VSKKEILDNVKKIISNLLQIKEENINESTLLVDDLGMDSVAGIELLFEIKEKFEIDFPQEDFSKIKKIKDIVDYIKKILNKEPQSE